MAVSIEVKWTGNYPNLCSGRWIIIIDGKELSLPKDIQKGNMRTYGDYQSWHFEDWNEVWESYDDGDEFSEWIYKARVWLYPALTASGIDPYALTMDDLKTLYQKIQAVDWRHVSCGGCI